MKEVLLFPFYNREEQRPRALWRLLIQIVGSVLLLLPGPAIVIMLYAQSQGIPFEGIPFIQPTPLAEQAVLNNYWMNMLIITLSGLSALASVWLAAKFIDRRPMSDFGLHLDRDWWLDLVFGAVLGIGLMSLIFLVEWMMGWVEISAVFHNQHSGTPFPLTILFLLLFYAGISIGEELVVRGYMLTNTAEGLNLNMLSPKVAILLALLISALNFGLGHQSAGLSTLNITLAGVLLGLGYVLTGDLALPLGFHFTWNVFQGHVFGFPVSGTVFDPSSILVVRQAGPILWTGGSYGPEAGLLGTAAFGIGIILVLAWVRTQRGSIELRGQIAEYLPASTKLDGDILKDHAELSGVVASREVSLKPKSL